MKLYSANLELKAIRTIAVRNGMSDGKTEDADSVLLTNAKALISSQVLAAIDESFFSYEPCKAAFSRIQSVAAKRSRILGYSDLVEDPSLDEEYRDILSSERKAAAKTKKEAEDLIEALDKYRKLRILYSSSKETLSKLQESSVDPDDLIESVSSSMLQARTRESLSNQILSVGSSDTGYNLIDQALDPTSDVLIKTGFEEFDTRAGGLPSEGVLILAGTTSGGKSVLRMNLMDYMYYVNHLDCCTISLEMNAKKEVRRLLSSRSRIPLAKINKGLLTEEERATLRKTWKRFHKEGRKSGNRYSLFCPTQSLTSQQAFNLIRPYGFRVVAVDYAGLFEDADSKDQWKALSSIVRQAKIFSGETHSLVIILAQLDSEDDRIRYSKGMLEHADSCWTWNYSKPEQRELQEIPIQQRKGRDQELFPFILKEEFSVMRMSNPDNVGSTSSSDGGSSGSDDDDQQRSSKSKPKSDTKRRKSSTNEDFDESGTQFLDVD